MTVTASAFGGAAPAQPELQLTSEALELAEA
jgi:hypothetical protein